MDKWIDSIKDQSSKNIHFIHDQENTYNLISMADVCVLGQRSTTGLEAIAFDKPLVKLDFAYTPNSPYSFVDQGVAVKMSAEQFAMALSEKTDFSNFIDKEKKEKYLKQELINTEHSIEKVCQVFKQTIQANTGTHVSFDEPDQKPGQKPDKKWSIIIQVPDNHDFFLTQLETVAFNSEDQGEYEILLLEPEKKAKETIQILDSLKGDLTRIIIPEGQNPITLRNNAAKTARGENLIFFEKNLAPLKGWLDCLDKGFLKYGKNTLFGARISDKNGEIANAGMVVEHNNTPVSAYLHLHMDFPGALKERSFQMVDYCVAMKKNLFLKTGGFTPDAGNYSFLDICLKTLQSTNDPDAVMYLPDLKMIFLDRVPQKENPKGIMDDSIYFYGKWNCCLWESAKELHKEDGFSSEDLAQAKMATAMQSAR